MAHKGLIIAGSITALLVGGGLALWPALASSEPPAPQTVTVMGNVTLRSVDVEHWDGTPGEECHGTNGFRDMTTNTPVTVYDANNRVVAKGHLESGKWYDGCVFAFTIPKVPSGMIQVQVSQRGMVAFTAEDVHDNKVMLQVGP
jgi:hypothetical protein